MKLFRELGRDYAESMDGTTVSTEPVNTHTRGYVIQRSQGKTLNKKRPARVKITNANHPNIPRFQKATVVVENIGCGHSRLSRQIFRNQPTTSRFHEAVVIIEDIGCNLFEGLRQMSEIDQPFCVFKCSWATLVVVKGGDGRG